MRDPLRACQAPPCLISIAEPLRNRSDREGIDARMPDPTHLDDVTGALARVIQVLRPPARNTLDRLGAYEGRTLETLFPAPRRVPAVTRRARWRLPGLVSEDLSLRFAPRAARARVPSLLPRAPRAASTPCTRAASDPTLARVARGCSTSTATCSPRPSSKSSDCSPRWRRLLQMEVVQLQPPYHGRRKPRSFPLRRRARTGRRTWCAASSHCARRCSTRARCSPCCRRSHRSRSAWRGCRSAARSARRSPASSRASRSRRRSSRTWTSARSSPMHRCSARCAKTCCASAGHRAISATFTDPHRLERTATRAPDRTHLPLRCPGRSLLPRFGGSSDVAALGQAPDPLVPDQPHGLHRPPARRGGTIAQVHRWAGPRRFEPATSLEAPSGPRRAAAGPLEVSAAAAATATAGLGRRDVVSGMAL